MLAVSMSGKPTHSNETLPTKVIVDLFVTRSCFNLSTALKQTEAFSLQVLCYEVNCVPRKFLCLMPKSLM